MNLEIKRQRVTIEGIVQGVGFRPFVFQIARKWEIAGWVRNDSRGVTVEAEGALPKLAGFLWSLRSDLPPLASISRFEMEEIPATGDAGFAILASAAGIERSAQIAPDSTLCPDCLAELFDPSDRRYRYPFINCTNCGPRYSIVTGVPYDRPLTTMAAFAMCPACRAEYDDPASRRFHAQPNACPDCGPRLALVGGAGQPLPGEPLAAAVALLQAGRIVAVKGLGGYHLAADAGNDAAVAELRRRKIRDEKPFALMSADSRAVLNYAVADEAELRLLSGVERPIVLAATETGKPHRSPGSAAQPLLRRHARLYAPAPPAAGGVSGPGDDQRQSLRRADRLPRRRGGDTALGHRRRHPEPRPGDPHPLRRFHRPGHGGAGGGAAPLPGLRAARGLPAAGAGCRCWRWAPNSRAPSA